MEIKSLSDYLNNIKEVTKEWNYNHGDANLNYWFRGESNSDYLTIPGRYRINENSLNKEELKNKVIEKFEVSYREDSISINEFTTKSKSFLKNKKPKTKLDYYILGQHYGLKTRLIDWTESPLLALFFALSKYDSKEVTSDAAIYILDPYWLNAAYHFTSISYSPYKNKRKEISSYSPELKYFLNKYENIGLDINHLDINDKYLSGKYHPTIPIAINPTHFDHRLVNQQSKFTLHGSEVFFFEDLIENKETNKQNLEYSIGEILNPIDEYLTQKSHNEEVYTPNFFVEFNKNKCEYIRSVLNDPWCNYLKEKKHFKKIAIKKEFILNILEELKISGINYSTVYPDLEGLVKELNLKKMFL